MKRTLAVLVENRPGVLTRVSGLFARRGFNIDSLAVGVTDDPSVSRMTIVVDGDAATGEKLKKQLGRLIDVIEVADLSAGEAVDRELALVKVAVEQRTRSEIIQLVEVFRAKIVDVASRSMVIEITGDTDKVAAFLELLREFGILEVVRTGKIAMARGERAVIVPPAAEFAAAGQAVE